MSDTTSWNIIETSLPIAELIAGLVIVVICFLRGRESLLRPLNISKSKDGFTVTSNGWAFITACGVALIGLPLYHLQKHDSDQIEELNAKIKRLNDLKIDALEGVIARAQKAESSQIQVEGFFKLNNNPLKDARPNEIQVYVTGIEGLKPQCVVSRMTDDGIIVTVPDFPVTQLNHMVTLEVRWRGNSYVSRATPIDYYRVEMLEDHRDTKLLVDSTLKLDLRRARTQAESGSLP
jgi:hypothetical protein